MDGIQPGVFCIPVQYAEILAILLVFCQFKLKFTSINGVPRASIDNRKSIEVRYFTVRKV